MEVFEGVSVDTKLFSSESCYLLVGPSGCGKTHTIKEALQSPARYMDLGPHGVAHLWLFPGADLSLESELNEIIDKKVFTERRSYDCSIAECVELRRLLSGKVKPDACQVIVLDDFIATTKDVPFVKQMLRLYKRHRRLCFIVASHQLSKDRTGLTYELVDHADRIVFCRDPRNIYNFSSLARRKEVGTAVRLAVASNEFKSRKEGWEGLWVSVYEASSRLFIPDFHSFSVGEPQKNIYAYGKSALLTSV